MQKLKIGMSTVVLICAALIIGALTWLVVDSLASRTRAFWALGLTFAVAVGAGLADWFTRDTRGDNSSWAARLRNPNWLARVGMAVFFGLGAGLFVQQFVKPTDTDNILGRIDIVVRGVGRLLAGQDRMEVKLDEALKRPSSPPPPPPWRAFQNLDGLWGEEGNGCRVVYRFERRDRGLTITLVRKGADMDGYKMVSSIRSGEGDVVHASLQTSTAPDETVGQALTFTYINDGAIERLIWLNETRPRPGGTRLEPCEAS